MNNYLRVYENAIPSDVIDYIVDFYNKKSELLVNEYDSVTKINHPWKHLEDILYPVLFEYFDCFFSSGGNLYKHTKSYDVHTDHGSEYNRDMINCLIPVYLHNETSQQKFFVFDQYVDKSETYCWVPEFFTKKDLKYTTKLYTKPYDHDRVYGKTDEDCPLDGLPYYQDFYKGLTGTKIDWKPGNLILFDSNHLHCTGPMTCDWKIGLTLHFFGKLQDLICE